MNYVQGAFSRQRVRDSFYSRVDPDSNEWVCKCGVKRKQGGHGYTNLVSHLERQHPAELDALINEEGLEDLLQKTKAFVFPRANEEAKELFRASQKHGDPLFRQSGESVLS